MPALTSVVPHENSTSASTLRSCKKRRVTPTSRQLASTVGAWVSALLLSWPIAAHGAQTAIERVRVSPDGDRVLAIASDGTTRVLAVSDVRARIRTVALRASDGQSLTGCEWISNERIVCSVFVFPERASPPYGRRRVIRLVAVDYDGENPKALFDKPPGRPPRLGGRSRGLGVPYEDLEHKIVSRLPGTPDEVLVAASREATPYTTVYRVDTRTGESTRAVRWQQGIVFWHADGDGKVRLGTGDYSHTLRTSTFTWLDDEIGNAISSAAKRNGLADVVAVPSVSDDCRRMVVVSTDRRTFLRYHLLDRTTGAVRHLGGLDVGAVNRAASRRLEVRFKTRDGRSLPMTLTLPTTGNAVGARMSTSTFLAPVVVLIDENTASDPESLDTWPHFFAARGYAVAQPAFRGARGYGAAALRAGFELRGRKLQDDIEDALAWLAEEQFGDSSRVCFTGRGRGAHLALAAALGAGGGTDNLRRCVAAYAVLADRETRLRHDQPLDYRVCGWFPCGDWEAWAAQGSLRENMRRAERAAQEPARQGKTTTRSPVVGAEHPGFPVLIKTDGRAIVHYSGTRRYRADVEKTGFFEHIAPRGSTFETEFLDEAAQLFGEILFGAERDPPPDPPGGDFR